MKQIASLFILILSFSLNASAYAGDQPKTTKQEAPKTASTSGEALHNKKCLTCHDNKVYSRKDRRVTSLPALTNQVNNCMKNAANANWTPKQTNSVVSFLNARYYKF